MLESKFQLRVIQAIQAKYPGAIVLKTDPRYLLSFPDLIVLNNHNWAALETKRTSGSSRRANQPYYVDLLNTMSYASFVHPENLEGVLYELQQTFR